MTTDRDFDEMTDKELRDAFRAETFPLDPIIEIARVEELGELARVLKVSGKTMARIEREGLSWFQAERFALRLGRHPAEVWPRLW